MPVPCLETTPGPGALTTRPYYPVKEGSYTNNISDLETILEELSDRVIAFHSAYATICGSAGGGVFLSQACFWSHVNRKKDRWFWKTQDEWTEETGLSRFEQETVRKQLRAMKILEEQRKDSPAKLYFRVNLGILAQVLISLKSASFQHAENSQSSMRVSSNQVCEFPADYKGTEKTSEITTESAPAALPATEYCPECGFDTKMCLGHKKPKKKTYPNRQRFEREIVQRVQEKRKGSTGEERAATVRERGKVLLDPAFLAREAKRVLQAATTDRGLARSLQAWAKAPEPD
jgi:hypothetical protein